MAAWRRVHLAEDALAASLGWAVAEYLAAAAAVAGPFAVDVAGDIAAAAAAAAAAVAVDKEVGAVHRDEDRDGD